MGKKKSKVVQPDPAPAKKKGMVPLFGVASRTGLIEFFGSETVPPGYRRVDVADAHKVYCLRVGMEPFALKVAFDLGVDE